MRTFFGANEKLFISVQKHGIPLLISPRHVLQLHHDDGGEQCGVDCGGAQLSPQDRRDPRHAYLGPEGLSPVAALDPEDGQTGHQ